MNPKQPKKPRKKYWPRKHLDRVGDNDWKSRGLWLRAIRMWKGESKKRNAPKEDK